MPFIPTPLKVLSTPNFLEMGSDVRLCHNFSKVVDLRRAIGLRSERVITLQASAHRTLRLQLPALQQDNAVLTTY